MTKEVQRLKAQLDLFWEQELCEYRQLGLSDNMSVLDCGCGPAYLLEKLLNEFSGIQYTGVEASEPMYKMALENIKEKKLIQCRIINQDITSIDLPDNLFDFVIMRIVLEHLPKPELALKEILRVLKIGGRAVFIDNDFDFHVRTEPAVPELSNLYSAYITARTEDKGNPRIGRHLPNLLQNAGYNNITYNTICAHNALLGDEAFSRSEGSGIALQLVHKGYLNSTVYDDLIVNWNNMLNTPGHSIMRQLFICSGLKTEIIQNKKESDSNQIESIIKTESLIGFISSLIGEAIETIPLDFSLSLIGLDSVAIVRLHGLIEKKYHIITPSMKFLRDHSIREIEKLINNFKHDSEPDMELDTNMTTYEEDYL